MDTLLVLPRINIGKCTGCGDCVESCHTAVLSLRGLKAVILRPEDCDYCTECEAVCSVGAIACPFEVVLDEPIDLPSLPSIGRLSHPCWELGGVQ
jgi:2-oxoglutarate ferredoxin oxidoreductase subunit delta